MGGFRRFTSGYTLRREAFPRRVAKGFESVHEGFGLWKVTAEGKFILEFSSTVNLTIANSWFRKRDEISIIFKSGVTFSQMNFFLIRKSDMEIFLKYKLISRESLTT